MTGEARLEKSKAPPLQMLYSSWNKEVHFK